MAMTPEELDATRKAPVEDFEEFADDEDAEQAALIYADLEEAFNVIRKCSAVMQVIADPVACPKLNKEMRVALDRVALHAANFVTETEDTYVQGEL